MQLEGNLRSCCSSNCKTAIKGSYIASSYGEKQEPEKSTIQRHIAGDLILSPGALAPMLTMRFLI